MTAWWQSLTTLEHALLYIAIPATLILVIQTILLFVGGGLGGEECGDSPEAELGGDLDGAGDPDTGTDTAAAPETGNSVVGAIIAVIVVVAIILVIIALMPRKTGKAD